MTVDAVASGLTAFRRGGALATLLAIGATVTAGMWTRRSSQVGLPDDRVASGPIDSPTAASAGASPLMQCFMLSLESESDDIERLRAWASRLDPTSVVETALSRLRAESVPDAACVRWLRLLASEPLLRVRALPGLRAWQESERRLPVRNQGLLAIAESADPHARRLVLDVCQRDLQRLLESADGPRASAFEQLAEGLGAIADPGFGDFLSEAFFKVHAASVEAKRDSDALLTSLREESTSEVYDARLRAGVYASIAERLAAAAIESPVPTRADEVCHELLFHSGSEVNATNVRMRIAWRAQLGDCRKAIQGTWGWWMASARGRLQIKDSEQAAALTVVGAANAEGAAHLRSLWEPLRDTSWRPFVMAGLADSIWTGLTDAGAARDLVEEFASGIRDELDTNPEVDGQVVARVIRAAASIGEVETACELIERGMSRMDVSARAILGEGVPWEVWEDRPELLLLLVVGWRDWTDADVVDRRCDVVWRRLIDRALSSARPKVVDVIAETATGGHPRRRRLAMESIAANSAMPASRRLALLARTHQDARGPFFYKCVELLAAGLLGQAESDLATSDPDPGIRWALRIGRARRAARDPIVALDLVKAIEELETDADHLSRREDVVGLLVDLAVHGSRHDEVVSIAARLARGTSGGLGAVRAEQCRILAAQ